MVFNVLSLSLIFVGLVTKCLGVLLLGVILPGTLLPGLDYFLSHVRKVSGPFSPPSETPMMWVLVHLMLSQRSLRRSSSFSFFFLYPALQQWFTPFSPPGRLPVLLPHLFCC